MAFCGAPNTVLDTVPRKVFGHELQNEPNFGHGELESPHTAAQYASPLAGRQYRLGRASVST
jgi:hypothetical protein